jgi:hypothetical protein
MLSDDAVRSDLRVFSDLCAGMNDRRGMQHYGP